MAGLINPNILRSPKTPNFGNGGTVDQAMSGLRPTQTLAPTIASRYPATGTSAPAPARPAGTASVGVQTTPVPASFKGKVAGTAQALTAAPAPAFDADVWAQNDWRTPPPSTAPAFDADIFSGNDWSVPANPAPTAPAPPAAYDPRTDPNHPSFDPTFAAPSWVGDTSRDPGRSAKQQAEDRAWEQSWDAYTLGTGPKVEARGNPNGTYAERQQYNEDMEYMGFNTGEQGLNRRTWRPDPGPAPGPAFDPDTFINNPWSEAGGKWEAERRKQEEEGLLDKPGTGEKFIDDPANDLPLRDPKMEAAADELMSYGGPDDRDFDKQYANAWRHAQGDLTNAYAGRGMGNSSDAMNTLASARTDLAAQQEKAEADYALESMRNYIGRMAAAGQILGTMGSNDVERWRAKMEGAFKSQDAFEDRNRNYLSDVGDLAGSLFAQAMDAMGDMNANDQQLVLQLIMGLPASYADLVNMDEASRQKSLAAVANVMKIIKTAKTGQASELETGSAGKTG